jgi:hypothetical protein
MPAETRRQVSPGQWRVGNGRRHVSAATIALATRSNWPRWPCCSRFTPPNPLPLVCLHEINRLITEISSSPKVITQISSYPYPLLRCPTHHIHPMQTPPRRIDIYARRVGVCSHAPGRLSHACHPRRPGNRRPVNTASACWSRFVFTKLLPPQTPLPPICCTV